jgi:hypothetical protein
VGPYIGLSSAVGARWMNGGFTTSSGNGLF